MEELTEERRLRGRAAGRGFVHSSGEGVGDLELGWCFGGVGRGGGFTALG
jgi:hypothetical protein